METEKKMDKKPRTGLWSSHNLNEESLTDTQIDFLMSCFEQNLEHARHVENERLTFNSIYMALVGGVLAFVYSTEVKYVMFSVGVTVLLIITGFIAMLLTKDGIWPAIPYLLRFTCDYPKLRSDLYYMIWKRTREKGYVTEELSQEISSALAYAREKNAIPFELNNHICIQQRRR